MWTMKALRVFILSCVAVNYAYKLVLTLKSVDEILKCDHSGQECIQESYVY